MKDTTTERVGRYQLLEPIGMGPCGTVSRAKVFGVAGFERQFAVKRFYPELTITSVLAQGLSTAARSYGSLEHPRIARMAEFGVAQGQTFTAVEFIPGLDALRLVAEARLAGANLAAGGALALVSQAARAVGYAHGRGLVHLGLSPTNVIVNSEGDIKITDFAVLAAGLPPRPIDVARLAKRIQYLAPEQLANEATSAATDVFSLGVIAYELVTGQRTFGGDSPQQVAQSIMSGPPPEPSLPRPIVRVLQRCVARSPFERFPDARALADALDAALRVAPVPGTRKDVGALVKHTLERIAAMHEGEMSGVLALNVGTGPIRREEPSHEVATLGRDSQPAFGLPASTMPDMPRAPVTTIAGLAPPPIPVPQGLAPPPTIPPPHQPGGASTLLGMPKVPVIGIPQIKPRPNEHNPDVVQVPMFRPSGLAPTPRPAGPSPTVRLDTESPTVINPPSIDALFPNEVSQFDASISYMRSRTEDNVDESAGEHSDEIDQDAQATVLGSQTILGHASPRVGASNIMTEEMSPLLRDKLNVAATKGTSEIAPLVGEAWRVSELPDKAPVSVPHKVSARLPSTSDDGETIVAVPRPITPPSSEGSQVTLPTRAWSGPSASRTPLIIGAVLVVSGIAGVVGWQLLKSKDAPPAGGAKVVAPMVADAGVIANATDAKTVIAKAPADAQAVIAKAPADAQAVAKAPDAGVPAGPVTATQSNDMLTITSKPSGAHVFLDGSDSGVTPLKLPGSTDRHTIALLLPGHDLYIAQVDGHGVFSIPLKEVTPTSGPAGIKVLKCKDKDRHYVFVDGKPTGQMCPTERIGTDVGPHTIEVYDAGSESRKKWDIVVKDTRLSYRVKIE